MNDLSRELNELIPRLRRYARALTGDSAAADELVQNSLERAWIKLHLWRRGSNLRTWLFTIMHNMYVNQVRGHRGTSFVALNDEALEVPARGTETDPLEIRDLDVALRCLSDDQREVLLLIALEQLSYEEVAKALAIPVGTVMSRLSRARERLRLLLSGAVPRTENLKIIK